MLTMIVLESQTSRRRLTSFFFFQAEDGIRDLTVTGVQTCALPISIGWLTTPTGSERIPATNRASKPGWLRLIQPRSPPRAPLPESADSFFATSSNLDRKSVV